MHVPVNRWVGKQNVVLVQRNGNYFTVISDELMVHRASRLALADMLSERSQTPESIECGSVYVKFEMENLI